MQFFWTPLYVQHMSIKLFLSYSTPHIVLWLFYLSMFFKSLGFLATSSWHEIINAAPHSGLTLDFWQHRNMRLQEKEGDLIFKSRTFI